MKEPLAPVIATSEPSGDQPIPEPRGNSVPPRDALDDKVNRVFAGKVVRKDLVRKLKVGANVPVFVLEYLLGKYCASSDEAAIQMGLQVVRDTLANNYTKRG
jgi:ATP-dependent Lon protease